MKKIIFLLAMFFTISAYSQSGVIENPRIPTQAGNAGKYLKTNGSKMSWFSIPTPTYAPGVSAALTGSGTVGFLPMYSSANTFTNSYLSQTSGKVNISSANLLIGATYSSTPASLVLGSNFGTQNFLGFGNNCEAGYFFTTTGKGLRQFYMNGNNIDINFSSDNGSLAYSNSYVGAAFRHNVQIGFEPSSPYDYNNTVKLHVRGVSSSSSDFAAKFKNSSNNDLLVIQNDGKVGIGVSSPTANLQVNRINDGVPLISATSGGYEIFSTKLGAFKTQANKHTFDGFAGGEYTFIADANPTLYFETRSIGQTLTIGGSFPTIETFRPVMYIHSPLLGIGSFSDYTDVTAKVHIKTSGTEAPLRLEGVPTSSVGLPSGTIWSDAGTLKIVP